MPVCVECCEPVSSLFTSYGKGNVCLTQCLKCGKFADKYIEFDYTVVFVDMLLHKPQVYRHLLFNELGRKDPELKGKEDNGSFLIEKDKERGGDDVCKDKKATLNGKTKKFMLIPSWGLMKLCFLLILFEVYIKWAKIDKSTGVGADACLSTLGFATRYVYLFVMSLIEFLIFQLMIIFGCAITLGSSRVKSKIDSIAIGMIISSFGKILHIVMVIWDYHEMEFAYLINVTVFTSNLEALSAIFSIKYPKAALILGAAIVGKFGFQSFAGYFDPSFPISVY